MCEHHPLAADAGRARWALSRRDALKLALAAGVVSIPALASGRLLLESAGQPQPAAPVYVLTAWDDDVTTPLLIASPDGADPAVWAEILRVEGLPYAHARPLTALTLASLRDVAAVIVPPGRISTAQAELLRARRGDVVSRDGGTTPKRAAGCWLSSRALRWRRCAG